MSGTPRSLSIRNKIILIALSVTFLAMAAGSTVLVVGAYRSFRRDLRNSAVVNTSLIAEYCATPLLFEDREGAREVLGKLNAIPSVQEAVLFDNDMRIFATFRREGFPAGPPPAGPVPSEAFDGGLLRVFRPVVYKGEKCGSIYVGASAAPIGRRVRQFLTAMAAAFLGLLGLAYLLARKLEGLISRPILDLARASAEISRRGDYSIRAKKWEDDEVGLLTDEFNAMLDQIRKRNEERERLNAELESKNKELEQIIYVASHDLRSPLINIQGFNKEIDFILKSALPLLHKRGPADPEYAGLVRAFETEIPGHMEYIFNSVRKMDALLKGLLRVSRLGRDPVMFGTVDVQKLLGEVLGAFEFKMKAEGIDALVGSLPLCRGDAVKMNQVFSNLVDNAIKYRAPGRPLVIRISGKAEDGRVVYCVEDNGIGIAPEHHAKIFEIFNRLDPGKTEGEGLGLTVVSKIVARHGGAVRVESELGRGSRFFVTFPAAAAQDEKADPRRGGSKSPRAGGAESGEASG